MKLEGLRPLQVILLKRKSKGYKYKSRDRDREQKLKSLKDLRLRLTREKKGNKKHQKQEPNQRTAWSHVSNWRERPCLTLCFNKSISFLKMTFARGIEGWIPSKISLFLEVQIVQLIKITADMKNLELIWAFIASTTSGKASLSGVCTCMNCQHCLAKGHCRNKWLQVSSWLST